MITLARHTKLNQEFVLILLIKAVFFSYFSAIDIVAQASRPAKLIRAELQQSSEVFRTILKPSPKEDSS